MTKMFVTIMSEIQYIYIYIYIYIYTQIYIYMCVCVCVSVCVFVCVCVFGFYTCLATTNLSKSSLGDIMVCKSNGRFEVSLVKCSHVLDRSVCTVTSFCVRCQCFQC